MMQTLKKYAGHVIAIALVAGVGFTMVKKGQQDANKTRPKNANEFAQTSAMIVIASEESGGSGVILSSNEKESTILTNKHVCQVIQGGGLVLTSGKKYKIASYKIYSKHDICMVKVLANLGVNTVVAEKELPLYTHAYVSGHPSLLPHVLSEGYFSSHRDIEVLVDVRDCTDEDIINNAMACLFMGGVPVIKKFEGQLVTATIMPGSSGSGVFNEDGEIAGLIFAGSSQGLSYGFMVPLKPLRDFLANQDKYKWRKPSAGSNSKFFTKTASKIQKGCRESLLTEFCTMEVR